MCSVLLKSELPLRCQFLNPVRVQQLSKVMFKVFFHYTFLSPLYFEGVLQNSKTNYFRQCSRTFFFFLYRMEDKGEVKCIKFSLGNKILAVQRTSKSVVRLLRPTDRKGIGAETLVLRVPE